jgi:hypothetical protein
VYDLYVYSCWIPKWKALLPHNIAFRGSTGIEGYGVSPF